MYRLAVRYQAGSCLGTCSSHSDRRHPPEHTIIWKISAQCVNCGLGRLHPRNDTFQKQFDMDCLTSTNQNPAAADSDEFVDAMASLPSSIPIQFCSKRKLTKCKCPAPTCAEENSAPPPPPSTGAENDVAPDAESPSPSSTIGCWCVAFKKCTSCS